ncbi:uncharacterized protein BCR38DRAFT_195189 [Pseudomassariella vexata]|uniref:Uncharacterized protein n=1 Tax=Pseudomassariella vexata TaxID=1141098 RepID=A0A1Y2E1I0_9PEZI|nr:uncharacterized protein BCR38DRAFT_195189 [Pseudomassariella vexata]ORY65317.1 hypothetical protein BCR38DRAFT_195189 [Pseudomassariella vexata]
MGRNTAAHRRWGQSVERPLNGDGATDTALAPARRKRLIDWGAGGGREKKTIAVQRASISDGSRQVGRVQSASGTNWAAGVPGSGGARARARAARASVQGRGQGVSVRVKCVQCKCNWALWYLELPGNKSCKDCGAPVFGEARGLAANQEYFLPCHYLHVVHGMPLYASRARYVGHVTTGGERLLPTRLIA